MLPLRLGLSEYSVTGWTYSSCKQNWLIAETKLNFSSVYGEEEDTHNAQALQRQNFQIFSSALEQLFFIF
jgi:hypothetical protein